MTTPQYDPALLDELRMMTLGHMRMVEDAINRFHDSHEGKQSVDMDFHYAEHQLLFAMKHLQFALMKVQEFGRVWVTVDSFLRELASESTILINGAESPDANGKGGDV